MLSKTAAKRQAHRESSIFQVLVGHWGMQREGHPAVYGLTYPAARAELAAWRAARVRELMGAGGLHLRGTFCRALTPVGSQE